MEKKRNAENRNHFIKHQLTFKTFKFDKMNTSYNFYNDMLFY